MSKHTINNFLSLIKFSHTIFALPFALIGFFIAVKKFAISLEWNLFLKVVLCMIFARSAAMGFNRYIDRDIDKLNPRTSIREIPMGIISPNAAMIFILINVIFFILTTYFINRICFYLSPVALIVILGYSYTKRFTALCHLVLGLGLSLAPIGAFLAVSGFFDVLPILFSFIVLFWVSGFDIIYALQDERFDKDQQLNSIPAKVGLSNALKWSSALHILCFLFVLGAGYLGDFGWMYWLGALIFSGMLFYQHRLVKPNDLSKVNMAFATTNGFASVVFAVFVLLDMFL